MEDSVMNMLPRGNGENPMDQKSEKGNDSEEGKSSGEALSFGESNGSREDNAAGEDKSSGEAQNSGDAQKSGKGNGSRAGRIARRILGLAVATAVVGGGAYWYLTRQTITKTEMFGLKIEKQKQVLNAMGTVDCYFQYADYTNYRADKKWYEKAMEFFKSKPSGLEDCYKAWDPKKDYTGDGMKTMSAIYSYTYEAGFDFTKNRPTAKGDTVYLKYPEIVYLEKGGNNIYFKGKAEEEISFTDTWPMELALEMIAKDFANRSGILEQSKAAMEEFLSHFKGGSCTIETEASNTQGKTLRFPYSPVEIDFFPGNLRGEYTFRIDSTRFDLAEFVVHDNARNMDVYRISYEGEWKPDHDKTIKFMKEYYLKEICPSKFIRVLDPQKPDEKVVFFTDDVAYIFIGGKYYQGQRINIDDQGFESTVKPDMIYLLNCLHKRDDDGNLLKYLRWKQDISDCMGDIGSQRYAKALESIDRMTRLDNSTPSLAEECMRTYASICNGNDSIPDTSDPHFNEYVACYRSVSSMDSLRISKKVRERNLRLFGEDVEVNGELKKLYLTDCKCSDEEKENYRKYLLQCGIANPESVKAMDAEGLVAMAKSMITSSSKEKKFKELSFLLLMDPAFKLLIPLMVAQSDDAPKIESMTDGRFGMIWNQDEVSKKFDAFSVKDKIVKKLRLEESSDTTLIWVNEKDDKVLLFTSEGVQHAKDYDSFFFIFRGKSGQIPYADLTEGQVDDFGKEFNGSADVLSKMQKGYAVQTAEQLQESIKEMVKERIGLELNRYLYEL